jgi:hypothetical protein
MAGFSPSFFFLARFLEDIQKCFVLFTTLRAYIQMFAHEWHELGGILLTDLSLHVFVDSGIDFIARNVVFPYAFEDAQKSQHGLVGQLLLMIEAAFNLLNEGSDVHNLCL